MIVCGVFVLLLLMVWGIYSMVMIFTCHNRTRDTLAHLIQHIPMSIYSTPNQTNSPYIVVFVSTYTY